MSDVLIGGIEKRKIVIVDYDPRWPEKFQVHTAILARVLGSKALAIEHVGSTSVPGLAAKPIVDIDVLVEDPSDEETYLPALMQAGYVLRVREPDWHQHRMFRTPELDVHVHIFGPDCVEVRRNLAFRDRLRACEEDRLLYESVKRKLAREDWPDMNAYARAKTEVVEEIIARALQEAPIETSQTPPDILSFGQVRLHFVRVIPGEPSRDFVPAYHFRILVADGSDVGHINFRVGDTEHVRVCAGHIGFEVGEQFRGHGYAFEACRAIAPFVRSIYEAVTITCDPDNVASVRTIERLGAKFTDEVSVPAHDPHYQRGSRRKRRYRWAP